MKLVNFDMQFMSLSLSFKGIAKICKATSKDFNEHCLREFIRINAEAEGSGYQCSRKDAIDMLAVFKFEHARVDQELIDQTIRLIRPREASRINARLRISGETFVQMIT